MKKNLAILLFDDVEVLDFAGPFEVFSITNELNDYKLLNMFTVASEKRPILAKNGLSVNPDYLLSEAPESDVFIVPGGSGARKALEDQQVIRWIQDQAAGAEKVLSVCTGSFLLAKAGLLGGLKATTHYSVLNTLAELEPDVEIVSNTRYVDNGKIVTAAGVTAGIDMCLYVVGLLYGKEKAEQTAAYIEYVTKKKRDDN